MKEFAEFGERPVRGVPEVGAGEAPQDGLGLSGAHPQGAGESYYLIVLVADKGPIYGTGEDGLQVRIGVGVALAGSVEALGGEALQARHEPETEHVRESERNLADPVGIDEVAIHAHRGAAPQDAFYHGGYLGGGDAL